MRQSPRRYVCDFFKGCERALLRALKALKKILSVRLRNRRGTDCGVTFAFPWLFALCFRRFFVWCFSALVCFFGVRASGKACSLARLPSPRAPPPLLALLRCFGITLLLLLRGQPCVALRSARAAASARPLLCRACPRPPDRAGANISLLLRVAALRFVSDSHEVMLTRLLPI